MEESLPTTVPFAISRGGISAGPENEEARVKRLISRWRCGKRGGSRNLMSEFGREISGPSIPSGWAASMNDGEGNGLALMEFRSTVVGGKKKWGRKGGG